MKRLSIIALSLTITASSFSYTLMRARWQTSAVTYFINPDNVDVEPDRAIAAIQEGADVWATQSSANFRFVYGGITNGATVVNNGKNEVFFRNTSSSDGASVIATTYTYFDSRGRTLDSDMVFWDASFHFYTGTSGCSNGVYIEDVAAHEFGHMLGLDHSNVSGATMAPSIGRCSTASRSIAADDKAGVEALYPPTTGATPTPSPSPTATPSPTPRPSATPLPSPTPRPSATPVPTAESLVAPASPRPANGSVVSTDADLAWSSVSGATTYDVYVGFGRYPRLYAANVKTNSLALPRLQANTTVYWRVVAKNAAGSKASALWRFRTRSSSNSSN